MFGCSVSHRFPVCLSGANLNQRSSSWQWDGTCVFHCRAGTWRSCSPALHLLLKSLHVDELKGAHFVEGWSVCLPKFFGCSSGEDYDKIYAGAPKKRIQNVIRAFFGFEADASEESLVLFGAGIHYLRRLVLPCCDKIEHELLWGLTGVLLNEEEGLNANTRGVRSLRRVFARQCPDIGIFII